MLTHSSPRVNICVSQTLHVISVSSGWELKEICWCQIETNLDVDPALYSSGKQVADFPLYGDYQIIQLRPEDVKMTKDLETDLQQPEQDQLIDYPSFSDYPVSAQDLHIPEEAYYPSSSHEIQLPEEADYPSSSHEIQLPVESDYPMLAHDLQLPEEADYFTSPQELHLPVEANYPSSSLELQQPVDLNEDYTLSAQTLRLPKEADYFSPTQDLLLPVETDYPSLQQDLEANYPSLPQNLEADHPQKSYSNPTVVAVTSKPEEMRRTTIQPLTAERRGMKEVPIFRPGGARDPGYRGRKKRSIPPFVVDELSRNNLMKL